MRILLFGAGGMLGHDLVATSPPGADLIALSRADLDITDEQAIRRRVVAERPDVIVNAAAYTAVDKAQSDSDEAFRVNATAVGNLARIAAAHGARVVHFSTDYVFDGTATQPYTEDAATNPINVYGASKLAGERALAQSGAIALVMRAQWLFGKHGRSFPRTMLERARAGQPTKVVADQFGRPTYTPDLARSTWELVNRDVIGIFHVGNSDPASWHDVAREIFALERQEALLTSCSTEDYPTAAARPRYSVLATEKFERTSGYALRGWREALGEFIGTACC